eukprot:TRINITY_DN1385_c0_g1_i6.p4 TRINITY_DN1385_c0_g1~~TRINITY_DN1385_c0_g1_i6.p4  ORF type:complete len:117 (-),score=13.43 TRINITY_DN1385_c0_g1_i6:1024-1374(-)
MASMHFVARNVCSGESKPWRETIYVRPAELCLHVQTRLKFWRGKTQKENRKLRLFCPEEYLKNMLSEEVIFARVSPEHKYRVVSAFQQIGNIVDATGWNRYLRLYCPEEYRLPNLF